jgi:hypothetical protein
VLAVALLLPVAIPREVVAAKEGRRFAAEGRATGAFLSTLASVPGPVVVAGGLPGISEQFWSIRWYLRVEAGREDVRFLFLPPPEPLTPFQRQLLAGFTGNDFLPSYARTVDGLPGAIGILQGDEAAFVREAGWLGPAGYERAPSPGLGTYAVYLRP